ncbi:hypothetical protein B0T25DRAFT_559472 [Lasiosphaeria hispida]|uniref:Uncharacterized protein n=1 Tax=Lasiosphaeria hispida TaxID=260671 RepID=A0AAJ0M8J2_9PEZI|nr:hypothetical protein B0T25DRAFT_559472 [Lasiosphaeria hispida]
MMRCLGPGSIKARSYPRDFCHGVQLLSCLSPRPASGSNCIQQMTTATKLSPRFEIRRLDPKQPGHVEWTAAIITHSNVFLSPLWPFLYPENKTSRAYTTFKGCKDMVTASLSTGLSLGVFDTQYKFKRPESAATGGRLYWDESNLEATADELLEQMDFPLVSIAQAYDGAMPIDRALYAPLIAALPAFATMYGALEALDKRDPDSWKPKAAGEVIMRSGTATRGDYEGFKLAKGMAHYMMRDAAEKGFRGIQIETAHPAVDKIWVNPPAPFKGERIGAFHTKTYELEEDGKTAKPFEAADLRCTKVYVTLKA